MFDPQVNFQGVIWPLTLRFPPKSNVDVINVEMKIKKTLKNVKNVQKFKKNVCKRWIKNVADICHESNYYLCTLSHM